MRRLSDLFSDTGLIIRTGWRAILGASLILWAVFLGISMLVSTVVVEYLNIGNAVSLTSGAVNDYGDAALPA
jgi:hypothetical protein